MPSWFIFGMFVGTLLPRFAVKARSPQSFLTWLRFEDAPDRLSSLKVNDDLEGFIRHLSKRMGRVGLQKPIAILRNFSVSWLPTVPFRLGSTQ